MLQFLFKSLKKNPQAYRFKRLAYTSQESLPSGQMRDFAPWLEARASNNARDVTEKHKKRAEAEKKGTALVARRVAMYLFNRNQ